MGDELKCKDSQTPLSIASCILLLKVNGKLIRSSISGRLSEMAWLFNYLVKTKGTTSSPGSKVSPGEWIQFHLWIHQSGTITYMQSNSLHLKELKREKKALDPERSCFPTRRIRGCRSAATQELLNRNNSGFCNESSESGCYVEQNRNTRAFY